jgi:hypothetical protein
MLKPNNPNQPQRMTRASQITQGTFVRVYFNLHRKCFSVQARNASGGWVVIAHVNDITLTGVTPHVSQSGRARVKRENRKNVHALVTGNVVKAEFAPDFDTQGDKVTYNPYKLTGFARIADVALLQFGEFVRLSVGKGGGIKVIGGTFGVPGSAVDLSDATLVVTSADFNNDEPSETVYHFKTSTGLVYSKATNALNLTEGRAAWAFCDEREREQAQASENHAFVPSCFDSVVTIEPTPHAGEGCGVEGIL